MKILSPDALAGRKGMLVVAMILTTVASLLNVAAIVVRQYEREHRLQRITAMQNQVRDLEARVNQLNDKLPAPQKKP